MISTFKPKFYPYLILLISITGCSVKDSEDYKSVVSFNAYLQEKVKEKEKELEEITNAMALIENNLSEIRKQEGVIGKLTSDTDTSKAGKIEAMFSEISTYMEENQKMVALLDAKLKKEGNQNKGLANLLAQQKRAVLEKEQEIMQLQQTIDSLQVQLTLTIENKNAEIKVRDKQLSQARKQLDEKEAAGTLAYYRAGSSKELIANQLIKKEGGILGAGKTLKLTNQFDTDLFKSINIKLFNELELGSSAKPKVLSAHPPESYYFVKTDGKTYLKITNQEKFWSATRFLVIVTDK
jgi:hypothetical protein